MYTEADDIYYYFTDAKELHILPTIATREWFIVNQHKLLKKTTSTEVNGDIYTSEGFVVPRGLILNNVEKARKIDLRNFLTN